MISPRFYAPTSAHLVAALLCSALLAEGCHPPATVRSKGAVAAKAQARPEMEPKTLSALQQAGIAVKRIACNGRVVWIPELNVLSKRAISDIAAREGLKLSPAQRKNARRVILGYMVRLVFQQLGTQNLGAMRLKGWSYTDAQGKEHPLLVFRSGVTTDAKAAGSCLRSLLGAGGVKHIVNLYGGHFPLHEFIRAEKEVARELGATHFDLATTGTHWRKLIKRPESYQRNREKVMQTVATLIRDKILRPGGRVPRGNVYFHCGGGMHRSGMIFGILRRCINGDDMKLIEEEYKRHTAYQNEKRPGGYEALNVRFIREFDCSLLEGSRAPRKSAAATPLPRSR